MAPQKWSIRLGPALLALVLMFSTLTLAWAEDLNLKKNTDIKLAFDSSLSSKTAKSGDHAWLHVIEPVVVDGKTVIAEGTKVRATVEKVSKRGRFGVNGKIQLKLDPIKAVDGTMIPLGFHTATKDLSRPGTAAGASVGSALVLGPVGLVAGVFVVGKTVNIKPGDKLTVTTDQDETIHVK